MSRLVAVFLVASFSAGLAIKCYVCSDCENVSASQVVECTANATRSNTSPYFMQALDNVERADQYACGFLSIVASGGKNRTTARGCLVSGTEAILCNTATSIASYVDSVTLNVCNTDGCNGSSTPFISIAALSLVAVCFFRQFS